MKCMITLVTKITVFSIREKTYIHLGTFKVVITFKAQSCSHWSWVAKFLLILVDHNVLIEKKLKLLFVKYFLSSLAPSHLLSVRVKWLHFWGGEGSLRFWSHVFSSCKYICVRINSNFPFLIYWEQLRFLPWSPVLTRNVGLK